MLFFGFDTYNYTFLAMVFLVGGASAAFYGWLPLYLPELFPTRVRATAQGIAFNSGRILAADKSGIVVACGHGALQILTVQRDGAKRMAAADFLNGDDLKAGDLFA